MKVSRTKILSGLLLMWLMGFTLYYGMPVLEKHLLEGRHLIFDYITWQNGAVDNIGYRLLWVIGDLTEGTIHKSLFASIGLVAFGFFAHYLYCKGSKKQGYPICAGLGVFQWVLVAAFSGMIVSSALYAGELVNGWMPTFLPGCTIPSALVFMYGKGWKISLTGGVISGIIQFPLGYFGVQIATKLGLPAIAGTAVFGMALAGIIVTEIFRRVPWIAKLINEKKATESKRDSIEKSSIPPPIGTGAFWVFKRSLADLTEIYFMGNEIAGLGLVLGLLFSWVLNPAHTGYGGPNFTSAILAAQFFGCSLAIFIHYDKWQKYGWYNTFTVSISQGVFVLTFGTTIQVIVLGAFLGAIVCPIFAAYFSSKIKRWHSMVGGTFGMGMGIALETVIARIVLPLLL